MGIEEVKAQLESMRTHFNSGFSFEEKELIDKLYYTLLKKHVANTGCQDCYRDAYIIIVNKLKGMDAMPEPANYTLKAGIVLHAFGTSRFFVLDMTDEDAENYLHMHPTEISKFQAYPEDWEKRVNARFAPESTNDYQDDQSIGKTKRGRKRASK